MRAVVCFMFILTALTLSGCETDEPTAAPLNLHWFVYGGDEPLYNSLKGIQVIEQITGVDITFKCSPENSEDAYKMMIAAGTLPDIITWPYSTFNRLYIDGIAVELTELLSRHAPNLTALYLTRPEILKQVRTIDGEVYYFPVINPMLTEEERCRKAYSGLIMRRDWLKKTGLSVPETIDDWYAALNAFKKMDTNGNGLADEIPYEGSGLSVFKPAFGILNGFFINMSGEVSYCALDDSYKIWLETMHKWYAEGLIGNGAFTYSSKLTEENILSSLAGSFYGLDNAWRYYLPSLRERDPEAAFVPVPWPKASNGSKYTPVVEMASNISKNLTIVTTQCTEPEAAVRLIDYFYSREGSDLVTWGIEGETYEVDADGQKHLLPLAFEIVDAGYLNLYTYAIAHMGLPKYDGETVVLQSYPDEQLVAEKEWADCHTGLIYPPTILFSQEETELIAPLMADIETYAAEMEISFISGQEPISNYDNFIETLKRKGIETVLEIYRKNYAAYMAR